MQRMQVVPPDAGRFSPLMRSYREEQYWDRFFKRRVSDIIGMLTIVLAGINMVLNYFENMANGWWNNTETWLMLFLSLATNGCFLFLVTYNKNKWYMKVYGLMLVGYGIIMISLYLLNG